MYENEKKQMREISSYAGARKDYVQGGGGNTSTKFDARLMAIKASGYTLAEITEEKGYVTVDYKNILDYYRSVDISWAADFEKKSLEVSLNNVVLLPGMENKRPSVEVGFHSLLKKCVIHTHSVYANILCCCEEGRAVADDIFAGLDVKYTFIPYIDPGFRLTLAISEMLTSFSDKSGRMPDVIFLENHGVITHADNSEETIALHETVNDRIREYFNIGEFPQPAIRGSEHGFASDTAYLKDFLKKYDFDDAYFNALRLYPDQLIYLGSKIGGAIRITDGDIGYIAGEKEALTMEETLLGVAFVIDMISQKNLHLRQMDEKGASFINNWESEKYRSQLIK